MARLHLVGDVEASGGVCLLDEQLDLGGLGHVDPVAQERPVEEGRRETAV